MFLTVIALMMLPRIAVPWQEANNTYTRYNYCDLNCDTVIHTACGCAKTKQRKEVEHPKIKSYRGDVLYHHNFYRNKMASGQATNKIFGVSNMMIMQYDLELEYFVRCHALNRYRHLVRDSMRHDDDDCRKTKSGSRVGQNIYGSHKVYLLLTRGTKAWYNDYVKIVTTNDFLHYKWKPDGYERYFYQYLWWSTDRVGCAEVQINQNQGDYKYTLICNYASTMSPNNIGNTKNSTGFIIGQACVDCPNGTRCESSKFKSLCGEVGTVPSDLPAFISKSSVSVPQRSPFGNVQHSTNAVQDSTKGAQDSTTKKYRFCRSGAISIRVNKFIVGVMILILYLA